MHIRSYLRDELRQGNLQLRSARTAIAASSRSASERISRYSRSISDGVEVSALDLLVREMKCRRMNVEPRIGSRASIYVWINFTTHAPHLDLAAGPGL